VLAIVDIIIIQEYDYITSVGMQTNQTNGFKMNNAEANKSVGYKFIKLYCL